MTMLTTFEGSTYCVSGTHHIPFHRGSPPLRGTLPACDTLMGYTLHRVDWVPGLFVFVLGPSRSVIFFGVYDR